MKNYKLKIISLAVGFLMCLPLTTHAQASILMPYGGYNLVALTGICDCVSNVTYVWFYPFLPLAPYSGAPMAISLPVPLLYANYIPEVEFTWSLGKYIPGVQTCWMYSGYSCVTVPTLGYVYMAGSSLVTK